jgi:hypothetical protein
MAARPSSEIQLARSSSLRNQLRLLLHQSYPEKGVVKSGLIQFQQLSEPLVLVHNPSNSP